MTLNKSQEKLLNLLEYHHKNQKNRLYHAGPYWNYKTKKILYWLKRIGINNFRGLNSGVGTSYTDSIVKDVRYEFGVKGRIASLFFSIPILSKIFNLQINLTHSHILKNIYLHNKILKNSERIKLLISKYKIENSTSFDCVDKVKIENKEYSTQYLSFVDRLENLSTVFDFKKINSIIEIGGGYGANIHLLLQNFKNIRKIIYVDIFPNIFIGTEYLRFHFGNAVKDYSMFKDLDEIKFTENNDLEIICIPNWSLKKVKSKVDKFHNCASFQEMTIEQVENYKLLITKILNKNLISLLFYKGWKDNNTLSPDSVNNIFNKSLKMKEFTDIAGSDSVDLVYLTSI